MYVRVDTGVIEGDEISPFYDPMISKLVVWDEDRERALTRLSDALANYHISGLTSNISFLGRLAASKPFIDADLDTRFIERHHELIFAEAETSSADYLPLMGLFLVLELRNTKPTGASPWEQTSAWRLNQPAAYKLSVVIDNETYPLEIVDKGQVFSIAAPDGSTGLASACSVTDTGSSYYTLTATINGHRQTVHVAKNNEGYMLFSGTENIHFSRFVPDLGDVDTAGADSGFAAPMNGTIVETLVSAGQQVDADEALVIMEGMKMQYTIRAPSAGKVTELFCSAGELVEGGAALLAFEGGEST